MGGMHHWMQYIPRVLRPMILKMAILLIQWTQANDQDAYLISSYNVNKKFKSRKILIKSKRCGFKVPIPSSMFFVDLACETKHKAEKLKSY